MTEQAITYDKPKWKRIPLPQDIFERTLSPHPPFKYEIEGSVQVFPYTPQGFHIDAQKGLGPVFTAYTEKNHQTGFRVHIEKGQGTVMVHALHLGDIVENNHITAEEGTDLTLIFDYTSKGSVRHHGITRVHAKAGSHVKLVLVQRLEDDSEYFQDVVSTVEGNGVLEMVDVQLGGCFKAVAYESHLNGHHSQSDVKSLYFGNHTDRLDLSFTMRHIGKQSQSHILSKGALDGSAKKVFRGNLMFDTGSPQSVGRETEYVVMLSDKVKSDSIPALLCSEDDVIGEHAASVGQIDQDKLFYLMSRGLSATEAKKLIVKAAFEEILVTIPNISLKATLTDMLERRLSDEITL